MQQQEAPRVARPPVSAQEDSAPSDRQDFAAEMRARAQAKRKAVVPDIAPVSMPQVACLLDMTSCASRAYQDVNFRAAWDRRLVIHFGCFFPLFVHLWTQLFSYCHEQFHSLFLSQDSAMANSAQSIWTVNLHPAHNERTYFPFGTQLGSLLLCMIITKLLLLLLLLLVLLV